MAVVGMCCVCDVHVRHVVLSVRLAVLCCVMLCCAELLHCFGTLSEKCSLVRDICSVSHNACYGSD